MLVVALEPVPGRNRALEVQERAQLSFLPILLQVRVARGGTEPGRHFTSSKGQAPAGDDNQGCPWLAQLRDPRETPVPSSPWGIHQGGDSARAWHRDPSLASQSPQLLPGPAGSWPDIPTQSFLFQCSLQPAGQVHW